MNFHLHISGQDLQVVEFLRAVDSFHRLDWEQRGTFFLPLGKFVDEEALVPGTDCRHEVLVDPDVVVELSTGLGHTHVLLEESIMRSARACVCPVDAASRESVLPAMDVYARVGHLKSVGLLAKYDMSFVVMNRFTAHACQEWTDFEKQEQADDDVLVFSASNETLGEGLGDDVAEKQTRPPWLARLMYTLVARNWSTIVTSEHRQKTQTVRIPGRFSSCGSAVKRRCRAVIRMFVA